VSDMRKEPQWVMLRVPSVPDGESARSIRKEVVSSLGSLVPSFLLSTCCLGPTLYVLFGVSVGGAEHLHFARTVPSGFSAGGARASWLRFLSSVYPPAAV